MAIDDRMFLAAPLNTNDRNACSPEVKDPNWRGIIIQAPRRVKFTPGKPVGEHGAFAAVPVCGYSMLPVPSPPTDEPIKLVAVSTVTGVRYRGEIVELKDEPSIPPPGDTPPSPEELDGVAVGTYFNPNLADFVPIPAEPGSYEIYVEYRGYKSNVVTVEILEE